MATPIAVLFDIDETLVHTGGAGARSWAWAFEQLYGVAANIGAHTSAGETDPQVGQKTFRAVLGREPGYDELARLYAKYLWHLSEDIWSSAAYRVLDGAEQLLTRLADAEVILGVVYGAMKGAARTKLEPGKLNRYFVFGSYGSDSSDRIELTRLGIAKAARDPRSRRPVPAAVLRRRGHPTGYRRRPRGPRHHCRRGQRPLPRR